MWWGQINGHHKRNSDGMIEFPFPAVDVIEWAAEILFSTGYYMCTCWCCVSYNWRWHCIRNALLYTVPNCACLEPILCRNISTAPYIRFYWSIYDNLMYFLYFYIANTYNIYTYIHIYIHISSTSMATGVHHCATLCFWKSATMNF